MKWSLLLAGLALAVAIGGTGPVAARGAPARSAAFGAPALTEYQLLQLHKVDAWDIEYHADLRVSHSGNGVGAEGDEVTAWSFQVSRHDQFDVTLVAKGDRGCAARQSCVPDREIPARGRFQRQFVSNEELDLAHCVVNADGSRGPGHQSTTFGEQIDEQIIFDGSSGHNGRPRVFDNGFFAIDYGPNPPQAENVMDTTEFAGTRTIARAGCLANSNTVGVLTFTPSVLFAFDDRPEAERGVGGGDTQVRIEKGEFVIHGLFDRTDTRPTAGFCGTLQCGPAFGPKIDVNRVTWEVRPHCRPIEESDLIANGNPNPHVADRFWDLDEDAIPDCWEQRGIEVEKSDGSVASLPLVGADPQHKDLYVEVDYMDGFKPEAGTLQHVVEAFARAPVTNPDGRTGIVLHAELGESLPHIQAIEFGSFGPGKSDDFWDLKEGEGDAPCDGFFGTGFERGHPSCAALLGAKWIVYRYGIFGDTFTRRGEVRNADGVAEGTLLSPEGKPLGPPTGGNDLMITLGGWDGAALAAAGGKETIEAFALMHELGHTLGLEHGGDEAHNCKPNYLSVLNYAYGLPSAGGDPNLPLDYSHGAHLTLDEASLNEHLGIGGAPGRIVLFGVSGLQIARPGDGAIDWNGSGGETLGTVSADIDRIDAIDDCRARGTSVDGTTLSRNFGKILLESVVPPVSAFPVLVNGAPVTPASVRLDGSYVYLTLSDPVDADDVVEFGYTPPAQNPITAVDGTHAPALSLITAQNRTGVRETLHDYDDWGKLVYSPRMDKTNFIFGPGRPAHPDVPDLTAEEVVALGGAADTVSPTTTASVSPAANDAGWNRADVTVTLSAVDNPGGSGVREIVFAATGAQQIAETTVAGPSVTVTVASEGTTTLTYHAVDNAGNAEASSTLTVRIDKTDPVVTCSARPDLLWPPDHRLVQISVDVDVADALSGPTGFVLSAVVSSEPGLADDAGGFTVGAADISGQLRAERQGDGPGRVYTLRYVAHDLAGNAGACAATVVVPHDQRPG